MKKDSQYYSKIARDFIYKWREENGPYLRGIYYGDLDNMENLADLFGWDKSKDEAHYKKYGLGGLHHKRFQFVMNKLDYESKQPDSLFKKMYINYPGIINKPTRCFILKELQDEMPHM